MEDTVIVIMLKDKKTGFLEKELGCYTIKENEEFIHTVFAEEKENTIMIHLKVTCDKEVNDWEYDAIFDYYDCETISSLNASIIECDGSFNPTWEICFPFMEEIEEMEKRISNLLALHKQELFSVYEAIADKKDEYSNGENQ